MFVRENKYAAGDYQEVDVVPLPDEVKEKLSNTSRKRKENMTRPQQQLTNDKRSYKWMRLAMNGNFFKGDYYLTLTYDEGDIPPPENIQVDQSKNYFYPMTKDMKCFRRNTLIFTSHQLNLSTTNEKGCICISKCGKRSVQDESKIFSCLFGVARPYA